jgi:hypothetical protein
MWWNHLVVRKVLNLLYMAIAIRVLGEMASKPYFLLGNLSMIMV